MGKIRKFIDYIFAEDEDLTVEYRLFLSAIIVGIFTSLIGSIINLVLNTSVTAAIIPLFLSALLIVLYYFIRVKGIFEPFIFPIIFMSIVGITIIWVFNGGINGSNVMPGFVILILGLITVSNKKKKYVFALFVGLFSVVYLIQFYRPDLIVNFSNETDRWIDSIFTLFYSSYFIFLIIKYFHENYSIERRKVSESEEKYRQAFQTSSDAININQRDGAYIDVNEGFTNLTGYTLKDVIGKFSTDINIWAIPEDLEKMVIGLKERGFVKNLESKFRCKDGSLKTAIMSANIIVLNNEPHILTITRDITERKLLEELILKSKQQYDNLVSNIPVGVYILHTKPEGTYALNYVSPRMAEMLDLSIESLIANADAIFEAIHPDDLEGFVRLNQEGIQQKRPFDWKGRVVVKDDVKWLNISSLPQELESGDTLWHGLIVDITEQKQAEKILWENHQRLEAIISSSPDGIGIVSLEGKVELISDKLLVIYGYTIEERDELIGRSLFDFIDSSNHKSMYDSIQGLLKGKHKDMISVYLAIKKDNTRIYVEVNSAILCDSEGIPEKILFVERDISERVKNDLIIINQNKELKELNDTKDKFFSIIAHDLRSPFNSFLGLTQIMAEELPSLTMTQVQEIAVSMSKSATNLYRLLENLLEWSQIQRGAFPFNPEVFQLGIVVGGSIDMIHESAKNKDIEIATDIAVGLEVFADRNMTQTIIRNLVSNAVKYTPKGGKISLSAKTGKNNHVEISIRDTGIGMSREMVDNLFRSDVQTSRKGTDGEPSTGLGLLLCKEFIEKNGGKIWVESEEGKGSTFKFTIPNNASSE